MSIYELAIGWAVTAAERRYLHWRLLACDEVLGAFLTPQEDVMAVLFDGGPRDFHEWASTLAHCSASAQPADSRHLQTHQKGASQ
jgi:hypothetical protein